MINSDFCKPEVKSSIFFKTGRHTGNQFFAGIKIFNRPETVLDNIPNRKKSGTHFIFRNFKNTVFGFVQYLINIGAGS